MRRGDVKAPCGVAALLMPRVVATHPADPHSASLCIFTGRFAIEDHVEGWWDGVLVWCYSSPSAHSYSSYSGHLLFLITDNKKRCQ